MDVSQVLGDALSAGNLVALPLALVGGLIAGMNPCCLALYPAAATACCSSGCQTVTQLALGKSVAFILGVALATALLGSVAAYIGRIATVASPIRYGIALIPIVMGVHHLGWLSLPRWNVRTFTAGAAGAFGLGALLSLVIAPCGTPVLASVLSFAAYQQSFAYGGVLLFVYGVGSGVPLMLVGTAAGGLVNWLDRPTLRKWLDAVLGGSLVLLGFYLLWRA